MYSRIIKSIMIETTDEFVKAMEDMFRRSRETRDFSLANDPSFKEKHTVGMRFYVYKEPLVTIYVRKEHLLEKEELKGVTGFSKFLDFDFLEKEIVANTHCLNSKCKEQKYSVSSGLIARFGLIF
jgi:hypothetical protein